MDPLNQSGINTNYGYVNQENSVNKSSSVEENNSNKISVEEIIMKLLEGNLSYEDAIKMLTEAGVSIDESKTFCSQNTEDGFSVINLAFEYNGQKYEYTFKSTSNVEAKKVNTKSLLGADEVQKTQTSFPDGKTNNLLGNELFEFGFTSEYVLSTYFDKNSNGTYSLKQPCNINDKEIHTVEDLKNALGLKNLDEFIGEQNANYSYNGSYGGGLLGMFGAQFRNSESKLYWDFHNLNNVIKNGGNYVQYDTSLVNMMAQILIDNNYVSAGQELTNKQTEEILDNFFKDLANELGKNINDLSGGDISRFFVSKYPDYKTQCLQSFKEANIQKTAANLNVDGNYYEFEQFGNSPLLALTEYINQGEPELDKGNYAKGAKNFLQAIYDAAGINSKDSLEEKQEKIEAFMQKFYDSNGYNYLSQGSIGWWDVLQDHLLSGGFLKVKTTAEETIPNENNGVKEDNSTSKKENTKADRIEYPLDEMISKEYLVYEILSNIGQPDNPVVSVLYGDNEHRTNSYKRVIYKTADGQYHRITMRHYGEVTDLKSFKVDFETFFKLFKADDVSELATGAIRRGETPEEYAQRCKIFFIEDISANEATNTNPISGTNETPEPKVIETEVKEKEEEEEEEESNNPSLNDVRDAVIRQNFLNDKNSDLDKLDNEEAITEENWQSKINETPEVTGKEKEEQIEDVLNKIVENSLQIDGAQTTPGKVDWVTTVIRTLGAKKIHSNIAFNIATYSFELNGHKYRIGFRHGVRQDSVISSKQIEELRAIGADDAFLEKYLSPAGYADGNAIPGCMYYIKFKHQGKITFDKLVEMLKNNQAQ